MRAPRSERYGSAQAGRRVRGLDAHRLRLEDLADLVAYQIVDGLHVQLCSQAGLHAVDDVELRRALALGLVALRVLQRDGHARYDGLQQPHLRFAERVVALVVFEDHATQQTRTGHHRNGHEGTRLIGAGLVGEAKRCLLFT